MDKKPYVIASEIKEKLTLSDARFIFEQAEKYLKETSAVGDVILARTITLITVVIGIIAAFLTYISNDWICNKSLDAISISGLISIIYLLILCWMLRKNIKAHKYSIAGRPPDELVKGIFFVDKIPKDDRTRFYYISEIEAYQAKITWNNDINGKRWYEFHKCLTGVILIPIVLLSIFILITAFPHLFCIG